jgi:hypothetical protein
MEGCESGSVQINYGYPDADPEDPKTYGSNGCGSGTLYNDLKETGFLI